MDYTSQLTPNELAVQLQEQALKTQMTADIIVKKTETEKGGVDECNCFEHEGELIDAARELNRCFNVLFRMCEELDQPASPKLETAVAAVAPTR